MRISSIAILSCVLVACAGCGSHENARAENRYLEEQLKQAHLKMSDSNIKILALEQQVDSYMANAINTTALLEEQLQNMATNFVVVPKTQKGTMPVATRLFRVTFSSEPEGATLQIDENPVANRTSVRGFMSPGIYRIQMSLDGFEPTDEEIEFTEASERTIVRRLKATTTKPSR